MADFQKPEMNRLDDIVNTETPSLRAPTPRAYELAPASEHYAWRDYTQNTKLVLGGGAAILVGSVLNIGLLTIGGVGAAGYGVWRWYQNTKQ